MKYNIFIVFILFLLNGCGGGGSSQGDAISKDYTGTASISSEKTSSRFLSQATFGPTQKDIEDLTQSKYLEKWIDEQLSLPVTYFRPQAFKYTWDNDNFRLKDFKAVWWNTVINAQDQLRQRMAFALSEIFVTAYAQGFSKVGDQRLAYHDILLKNAFGNYRDLLQEITLSPVMGKYLSMLNNRKSDESKGTHPDENYAREVMQLFSIGLVELNEDGTSKLDKDGNTIETYSQSDIEGLAKVFTGFGYKGVIENGKLINSWSTFGDSAYVEPMECLESEHEEGEKHIINNTTIPAGQTCQEDLKMALDTIFEHNNIAPFISKQLIQKFTTSNPSKEYVQRIAKVFNDNSKGVKGDLGAVLKAILLDEEAIKEYNSSDSFGKVKEPLIRLAGLLRAFNAKSDISYPVKNSFNGLGQTFMHAPTVFNFFRPDYTIGEKLSQKSLVSPELEIATEGNITDMSNTYNTVIFSRNNLLKETSENFHSLYLDKELSLAKESSEKLIEHLDLLLLQGSMSSEMKTILINHVNNISIPTNDDEKIDKAYANRVLEAIFLVMTSAEQMYLQ